MTSHILVSALLRHRSINPTYYRLQGIYPVIIIILAHAGRSYTAIAAMGSNEDLGEADCGNTSSFWDCSDALSLSQWPRPVHLSIQEIQDIYWSLRTSNSSSCSIVDGHVRAVLEMNSGSSESSAETA